MSDVGCSAPRSSDGRKKRRDLKLRKEPPYWFQHHTFVKERWVGRQLLEVMVTDFYQRTSAYYQWAILKGYCKINGEVKSHDYVLRQGDLLLNLVHRHEPAITTDPIRIIDRDDEEGRLVVVKPGSIPVHAAGRYFKLTLLELLKKELKIETIWTSNRIDRLTSGIMVCSTKKDTAHKLSEAFAMGKVRKAYVCRVRGRFPEGELVCKEPLVQCDRQSGVSVVHAIGKDCETIFNRMSYDADTNTSVVYCRPITGRTHQIRAHVQYLGYPIPNDPIYCHPIWEKYPPQIFKGLNLLPDRWKVEPESSLNVYGCDEIDAISAGLKTFRDEKDDFSRWKDEAMFTKKLKDEGIELISVAGPNGESATEHRLQHSCEEDLRESPEEEEYCPECLVPLSQDPNSEEELFIYLHAIKYETDDWTFEDELPWWAHKDWKTRPRLRSENATIVEAIPLLSKSTANGHQPLGPAGRDKKAAKSPIILPNLQPLLDAQNDHSSLAVTPTQPCLCDILLEVFGGMEDFAAREVHTKIQAILPNERIDPIDVWMHTSHIQVSAGMAARAALDLFLSGNLGSVSKAYLKIGEEQMQIKILETLEQERSDKVSLQESINQTKKAKVKAKKMGEELPPAVEGELDLKKRTETEETLLNHLRKGWEKLSKAREVGFNEWKKAIDMSRKPIMIDKMTFRGRVDRTGYHLPTLKTTDIEHVIGVEAWNWLNGEGSDEGSDEGPDEGPWSVSLTKPDLEVVVKLLPRWSSREEVVPYWRTRMINYPGSFVYLLRIPTRQDPIHRPLIPSRLMEGGTALARYRSFTLASALPIIDSKDEPVTIWEPCVGVGSIAIELDAILSRGNRGYRIYASDLSKREIEKAKEVLEMCKTSNRVIIDQVDSTDLEASIAFLGGTELLDGIVTDLPWGRRVLNHMTISLLYPALLKVWIQVLKPGGTIVVMTAEQKNFLRAIKVHEADMRKKDTGWVLIVEHVQTSGLPGEMPMSALHEEGRMSKFRTVACGYDVSVIFLRKRPLVD